MPTASGWLTALLALTAFFVGRALALQELVLLGAVGVLLMVGAWLSVRYFCPAHACRRLIEPTLVPAFGSAAVELEFEPLARRLWRLPFSGTDSIVAHLPNGSTERFQIDFVANRNNVSYDFRPTKRGVVEFGLLSLNALDPFALARRRWTQWSPGQLLVLPHWEEILAPHTAISTKTWQEDRRSAWQGVSGHDFYALREYLSGDDARHVHWKSSARLGQLMIRQNEHQWELGISVVLDNRLGAAGTDEFEQMVGAAASIISACHASSLPVRLEFLAGSEAQVIPTLVIQDEASYRRALVELARLTQGDRQNILLAPRGRVVAITAQPEVAQPAVAQPATSRPETSQPAPDEASLPHITSLFRCDLLVSFADGTQASDGQTPAAQNTFTDSLHITPQEPFAQQWNGYFGAAAKVAETAAATGATTTETAAGATP